MKKPIVLVIMDGVALGPNTPGNAVEKAYTPNLDYLFENYPWTKIKAHGTAVGLPTDDDMGNSEVGHNALGCGQIYAQGAKLVNQSIDTGELFFSPTWSTLVKMLRTTLAPCISLACCPMAMFIPISII